MPVSIIAGIPVNFPFDPYDLQVAYMEKVITCLRDGSNGVLESPTGTGKTLSLLCATLAWILSRKEDVQAQLQVQGDSKLVGSEGKVTDPALASFSGIGGAGASKRNNWGVPKVIYASRTHSQLSQAMQELKRTAYSFMHAVVLGSRDQLCIHPEVMREQGNSNKITMCKLRVQTKTCSFQGRLESRKDHPDLRGPSVMDIEDLVKVGQKLKICPYYASKELVDDADLTFMPYNYLLDPKARKANKVELNNTIVILDEAHNIEKICEESASVQIKSSDIAMAIDDVTHIMKAINSGDAQELGNDESKDFKLEDLALLKEMLLDLEKAIDNIVVDKIVGGTTFPAAYIFELLAKANFTRSTVYTVINLLDKLLQFLMVASQNAMFRKGRSFEVLSDLLALVFVSKEENMGKVYKSFKVHVEIEETKQQNARDNQAGRDGWLSKPVSSTSKAPKVINYWCFNPGFGMEQLLNKNVRSILLTSGTLAPLQPLIAELAMPVAHFLENPHIVKSSQVYVKIIASGPDREPLISNYTNRDNPKYISSLGQTILNVARIVPDGLLVFFPSYSQLNKCADSWQASGLWGDICGHKPIYVEPRSKEEFTSTMEEFYQSIRDSKGACFMAVCRGKVSEGLDFADRNGRAVIITGLPFPPLKDPKVILKKRYLEDNRTMENGLLNGQAWYGLEATRAVNQAIGRVIRHRNDYGAILLCDMRFQQTLQVQQLSKWVRGHLGNSPQNSPFGPVVRQLREFFKNAEQTVPKPKERSVESLVKESCDEVGIVRSEYFSKTTSLGETRKKSQAAHTMPVHKVEKANSIESWTPEDYASAAGCGKSGKAPSAMDFMSRLDTNVSSIDFNFSTSSTENSSSNSNLVSIHKRERDSTSCSSSRQKRYKLIPNPYAGDSPQCAAKTLGGSPVVKQKQVPEDRVQLLLLLRSILTPEQFADFTAAIVAYKRDEAFDAFFMELLKLFDKPDRHYLLLGMRRFLKSDHKPEFDAKAAKFL